MSLRIDPSTLDAAAVVTRAIELLNLWRPFLEHQAFSHEDLNAVWESVPTEWHQLLEGVTDEEIARMCLGQVPQGSPDSLRAFINNAQCAQLESNPIEARNEERVAVAAAHWLQASEKKRAEISAMAHSVIACAARCSPLPTFDDPQSPHLVMSTRHAHTTHIPPCVVWQGERHRGGGRGQWEGLFAHPRGMAGASLGIMPASPSPS